MSFIARLPTSNKPSRLLELVDRRLLNPEPLLPAWRSKSGVTATYDCPWCGDRHRHHVRAGQSYYSKLNHCPLFHRLFGVEAYSHPTFFYLKNEISSDEARRRYWFRDFQAMLAEWEYRDYPTKRRAA